VDDVGDVFAKPRDGEGVEALLGCRGFGCIGELAAGLLEDLPNKAFVELDLEVVEDADQIVFRRRHEGALNIDHHESLAGRRDQVKILGFEVTMGEALRGSLREVRNLRKERHRLTGFIVGGGAAEDQRDRPVEPFPGLALD
jgi:hypothetical protein